MSKFAMLATSVFLVISWAGEVGLVTVFFATI